MPARTSMVRPLATLGLLVALVAVPAAHAVAARSSSAEAQFVNLMNQERSSAGVAAVSTASDMSAVAYDWSAHMAETGKLAHNPDGSRQICCWTTYAENVGYHNVIGSVSETVQRLHDLFMDSSSHRANILNGSFDQVGVGVAIHDDQLWVTVNFRDHTGSTAPEPDPEPDPPVNPEPEPAPAPEPRPEPDPVDTTQTRVYLVLLRVELLETATGL